MNPALAKSIYAISAWLEQTRLSQAIQLTDWVVPTVQTVHILAIAIVAGSALSSVGREPRGLHAPAIAMKKSLAKAVVANFRTSALRRCIRLISTPAFSGCTRTSFREE